MPILNYTTEISSKRTAAEVQSLLGLKGAKRVSVDYDKNGEPNAIEFMIEVLTQPVWFRLPCNVEGVLRALKRQRVTSKTEMHARRVAWRIIKDWIEAQLAIVEANQAEMAEVFLPYAIDSNGDTVYGLFKESKQKQLSAGNGYQ